VGHGEFAGGLVSAVGQICGMADRLVVLTMMGMTPEDIEATIRDQLARTGARVIFTDLPAGSATIAARRIVKDDPGLVLVSGVKAIGSVNLGGIHHRAGRSEKLRYIYLTPEEERELKELEAVGVEVTAQDVPSARAIPLPEVLEGAAR